MPIFIPSLSFKKKNINMFMEKSRCSHKQFPLASDMASWFQRSTWCWTSWTPKPRSPMRNRSVRSFPNVEGALTANWVCPGLRYTRKTQLPLLVSNIKFMYPALILLLSLFTPQSYVSTFSQENWDCWWYIPLHILSIPLHTHTRTHIYIISPMVRK